MSQGIRTVPQVSGKALEKQGECIPSKIATGIFYPLVQTPVIGDRVS